MRLNVEKRRMPGRVAATVRVTDANGVDDALQRLQSWGTDQGPDHQRTQSGRESSRMNRAQVLALEPRPDGQSVGSDD